MLRNHHYASATRMTRLGTAIDHYPRAVGPLSATYSIVRVTEPGWGDATKKDTRDRRDQANTQKVGSDLVFVH